MTPLALLQHGEAIPTLFGILFVAVGALNVVKARAVTAFNVSRRSAGTIGDQAELSPTRVVYTRLVGGLMIVVGLGLAFGLL